MDVVDRTIDSHFSSLSASWSSLYSDFDSSEQENLDGLLLLDDEAQVRSSVELLLSFGDCGLCHVLRLEGDQVVLVDGLRHELLWKEAILEHVGLAGGDWFGVYDFGGFIDLKRSVLDSYGSFSYSDLSETERGFVVRESLRCVSVVSGSFMMGALDRDGDAYDSEKPRHRVNISRCFLLSVYPCTQGLYELVMGENPSSFQGSTRPVDNVSWCDAVLFCNRLSELEGLEPCYELPDGFEEACQNQSDDEDETVEELSKQVKWNDGANGYRLPTEAEWEYCARGGEYFLYSGSDDIDEVAWYKDNSGGKTHPVGQKKSNGFGLYDMSGNVWEWVWDSAVLDDDYDFTGASVYTSDKKIDPSVDTSDSFRVDRGGGWYGLAWDARVSYRSRSMATDRNNNRGFRFLRLQ